MVVYNDFRISAGIFMTRRMIAIRPNFDRTRLISMTVVTAVPASAEAEEAYNRNLELARLRCMAPNSAISGTTRSGSSIPIFPSYSPADLPFRFSSYKEVTMFMFLPFLLALVTAGASMLGRRKATIVFYLVTLVITLASFKHHATEALNLVF
ncbi:hypothetical protein FPJ27_14590 [Burkholderia sp. MS455]|uniref:DUF5993 family protein n=1 Tax=Burkholderia sp. MS455 TaxID=2811788 RepID=UPI00195B9807|nr:DUF5993 family protein [Burkholderia sp. MS455]QRR07534.1 hypothetical protein FPJ27_14590 [Burkholderia sp. MS455]